MEKKSVSYKRRSSPNSSAIQPIKNQNPKLWRDRIPLWILGLNNQFGYVLLLLAAHDILHSAFPEVQYVEKTRYCCKFTTGLMLLILNVPALLFRLLPAKCPKCFLPLTTISILLEVGGYSTLAFADEPVLYLTGSALLACGYGLGDYEISQHSSLYRNRVRKSFHGGTYDALVGASLYYCLLRYFRVDMFYIFLSLLLLPVLALFSVWCVLRPPEPLDLDELNDSEFSLAIFNPKPTLLLLDDKVEYVVYLMKYIAPLGFVVFLEGVVNQGLYEFLYFRGNEFDIHSQYRIYVGLYNLGMYACFTTRNLLLLHYVVICSVVQLAIASYFVFDVIFFFTGGMWFIALLAYVEGIITGVAYTSTMDHILTKEPSNYLDMAEAALKNSMIILFIISGITDFGIHHVISRLPEPSRP